MTSPRETMRTVDYHTAGEPFRIVVDGAPELAGDTILARREHASLHLDHVRRLLVNEPRGHADMYGCFVTPPDDDGADLGVVFFHNAGYSTACGHGTIALVTWAIDSGTLPSRSPTTRVTIDVPSGRLVADAAVEDGSVVSVRFRNVPAYVHERHLSVETGRGPVTCDVGFGGAFYASVEAASVGAAVRPEHLPDLVGLGREIKCAIEARSSVVHPTEPQLEDIYGVIFFEPAPEAGLSAQRNV
ncbi:MAG: proline racemase family protein, partial [Gaiellales bacterium]